MRIGVPKEIKNNEYRVGLAPAAVYELVTAGHEVRVETGAGVGAGATDADYERIGALVVSSAEEVWNSSELIIKVKEPLESEYRFFREDLTIFTYLHLAADEALTQKLLESGTTAIAYETVQMPDRSLPLLAPMSAIAGRLATQVAAYHLMAPLGGAGVLMGGVPGTPAAKVLVIGGGVVGEQAAIIARGQHAAVTVVDLDVKRLQQIDLVHNGTIATRYSTKLALEETIKDADVVIGSVLIPGAKAPKLVTNEMVSTMKKGAVLVDVAIDQGGCFEGSHPTTHDDPTFRVHDTTFYCVANMPGSVPVTATAALNNATLPYVLKIAKLGWKDALAADPALALGLHTHAGSLFNRGVGEALGIETKEISSLIG